MSVHLHRTPVPLRPHLLPVRHLGPSTCFNLKLFQPFFYMEKNGRIKEKDNWEKEKQNIREMDTIATTSKKLLWIIKNKQRHTLKSVLRTLLQEIQKILTALDSERVETEFYNSNISEIMVSGSWERMHMKTSSSSLAQWFLILILLF